MLISLCLLSDPSKPQHFKWPPYKGGKGTATDYNSSLPSIPYITDLTNGTGPAIGNRYNGSYSTFMYMDEAKAIIQKEAAAQLEASGAGMEAAPFFLYMAVRCLMCLVLQLFARTLTFAF